jgi:solute carrier family 10 (sodium/bile acid cotransporter), member 7
LQPLQSPAIWLWMLDSKNRPLLSFIDPYIVALLGMVVLATVLPVRGQVAVWAEGVKNAAIITVFFLHGAKLSRASVRDGFRAYRVHFLVFASTFILFPVLGLGIRAGMAPFIDPLILSGFLFLCLLPSTIQSSIAFTATAGGNVAAAVCSASLSNLVGIILTPILVALTLGQASGGFSYEAVLTIATQLLLPFALGQMMQPRLMGILTAHKAWVGRIDKGAILLVVYTAFSASVVAGLWQKVGLSDLGLVFGLSCLLLAVVMCLTWWASGRAGLSYEDRIVVLFCGSKKSLASGVPIAGAIFPPAILGSILLPIMLFHQTQLIVCAVLAQRFNHKNQNLGL